LFEKCLFDANVIIDFVEVNFNILKLFIQKGKKLYILRQVFNEIKSLQIDNTLINNVIDIIEPDGEDLLFSLLPFNATNSCFSAKLSSVDKLCFLTAKRNNYTLYTNDKRLHNLCVKSSVLVHWGLYVLIDLYQKKFLTKENAKLIVMKLRDNNQNCYNNSVVSEFFKLLDI
jgi:rRNA-processing protein FCF1